MAGRVRSSDLSSVGVLPNEHSVGSLHARHPVRPDPFVVAEKFSCILVREEDAYWSLDV